MDCIGQKQTRRMAALGGGKFAISDCILFEIVIALGRCTTTKLYKWVCSFVLNVILMYVGVFK